MPSLDNMFRLHYEPLCLEYLSRDEPDRGTNPGSKFVPSGLNDPVSIAFESACCSHATTRILAFGTDVGHVLIFSRCPLTATAAPSTPNPMPNTRPSTPPPLSSGPKFCTAPGMQSVPKPLISIRIFQKRFELFKQVTASPAGSPIAQLRISPNQDFLAIGTSDGEVVLYHLAFEDIQPPATSTGSSEPTSNPTVSSKTPIHRQPRHKFNRFVPSHQFFIPSVAVVR